MCLRTKGIQVDYATVQQGSLEMELVTKGFFSLVVYSPS